MYAFRIASVYLTHWMLLQYQLTQIQICLTSVDPDDDNDGIIIVNDLFPKDVSEWEDLNGDGLEYPLTLLDKIKLNSNIIMPILAVIILNNCNSFICFYPEKQIRDKIKEDLDKYDDFNIDFGLQN